MCPERTIKSVVYGRGNDIYDMKTGKCNSYELKEFITIEKGDKSVVIPSNYFCTDNYNEVNGVIYSERHIINSNNFGRTPEKELFFAINAYAKNDLDTFSIGNVIKRKEDGNIEIERIK
jgi:hypothetical protein